MIFIKSFELSITCVFLWHCACCIIAFKVTLSHTHTQLIHPSGMLSASIFWVIITWQSLSLWGVSTHDLWEEKVWVPSDKGSIICSEWMNIMAGLCPFSGPGHRHEDDSEDTKSTPGRLESLWCPSVIVHVKVIKRVRVKNYDACSVVISWRWILQSVLV